MSTILIKSGILITMDPNRRVNDSGWILIREGLIEAVGATDAGLPDIHADEFIDARRLAVSSGPIGSHSHAG